MAGYQSKYRAVYHSARWQKVRALVLMREPLCRPCGKRGKAVPANQVDHIVPLEEGGAAFDLDNLQPLCRSCHASKSFSGAQGGKERIKGCDENGLPLDVRAWWGTPDDVPPTQPGV